jgi:hypothetical protein
MMGQPRILMALARDGLLPESFFGAVHPRFGTPWKSTILTGILVALAAAFIPLDVLVGASFTRFPVPVLIVHFLLSGRTGFDRHAAGVLHRVHRSSHPAADQARRSPAIPCAVLARPAHPGRMALAASLFAHANCCLRARCRASC